MEFDINREQAKHFVKGVAIAPLLPFLYVQGKYTRWKVPALPDAGGDTEGVFENGSKRLRILALGESTVAGVGAESHEVALTGRLAKNLGTSLGCTVEWHAVGRRGIKIHEALVELVPQIPQLRYDVVFLALGGNDVFGLSHPKKWRSGLTQMIKTLQSCVDYSEIFVANVPMVRDFLAMPDPLRYILSRLAKSHHFNSSDLIKDLEGVYYFTEVDRVEPEFFSDGIHPSAFGYDSWSKAMIDSYLSKTKRFRK